MSIDFKSLADDLLGRSKSLLESWFPAGKYRGHEYVLGDLSGSAGDSLSINTRTGLWKDFASGETGGDLISLYAAAHGMSQLEAAKELGAEDDGERKPRQKVAAKPREPEPPKRPTLPAVGTHDCHHKVFGKPSAVWEYLDQAGALLGYVARYNPPGERKQIVPWTYAADGWGMGQWNDPRPMYGLQFLTMYPNRPVLLVEGEKAADAARQFAGHVYVVMTWPGGAQAWKKVDWSAIAGRKVLMWPDADDPGIKAMHDIAQHIRGAAPEIKIIDIDGLADGFDAADALTDGMDWAGFKAFATPRVTVFHTAPEDPPPDNEPPPPPPPPEGSKPAPDKPKRQKPTLTVVEGSLARKPEPQLDPGYWQTKPWAEHILISEKGGAKICFTNAAAALRHDPAWVGVIGYDQFAMRSAVLKSNEFGLPVGPWTDAYDFRVTEWLQRLGIAVSTKTASEAVEAIAHEHEFHPVHEYLNSLEWDGIERLDEWLMTFCGVVDTPYARAVGSKWMIGAVARALQPGCQMDTALVFEGKQGLGKSTVFSILGGAWFTDDMPEMHGKAAAEAVGGAWIVEIAELAAMQRSEIENVKAFITRRKDRFRPAYGRRVIEAPRSSIFCGTSNGHAYLKDDENRRFWPVEVLSIDVDGLRANRDHLWAEAVYWFKQGHKWYLQGDVTNEAREQQEHRRQADIWEDVVRRYMTEQPHYSTYDGQLEWSDRMTPLSKVTIGELLEKALGVPPARWTRSDQMRVSACLKTIGWERKRQLDNSWAYQPTTKKWVIE